MRMLMCMCMLNRRVHILFDKNTWNKLVKNAKSQNISAGELIRRAVREYMEEQKQQVTLDHIWEAVQFIRDHGATHSAAQLPGRYTTGAE